MESCNCGINIKPFSNWDRSSRGPWWMPLLLGCGGCGWGWVGGWGCGWGGGGGGGGGWGGVATCETKGGGRFKNIYEPLNLRAIEFSPVNKIHIFQYMGKIFCMEFQRYPCTKPSIYVCENISRHVWTFINVWFHAIVSTICVLSY